jgi:hypothetical protein
MRKNNVWYWEDKMWTDTCHVLEDICYSKNSTKKIVMNIHVKRWVYKSSDDCTKYCKMVSIFMCPLLYENSAHGVHSEILSAMLRVMTRDIDYWYSPLYIVSLPNALWAFCHCMLTTQERRIWYGYMEETTAKQATNAGKYSTLETIINILQVSFL